MTDDREVEIMDSLLSILTAVHTGVALVGIVAGGVITQGFLTANRHSIWTGIFFWTTVFTSVSGFFFPVDKVLPSHLFGVLSLILLYFVFQARYQRQMVGRWRHVYVVTAMAALYLNCFVGVVQAFLHVPMLHQLAPTQSDPAFVVAQAGLLMAFCALTVLAVIRFNSESGTLDSSLLR